MATMTQIEEDSDLQKPSLSSYRSSPLPIVGRINASCVLCFLLRRQCSARSITAARRYSNGAPTLRNPVKTEEDFSLIQAGMILIGYSVRRPAGNFVRNNANSATPLTPNTLEEVGGFTTPPHSLGYCICRTVQLLSSTSTSPTTVRAMKITLCISSLS